MGLKPRTCSVDNCISLQHFDTYIFKAFAFCDKIHLSGPPILGCMARGCSHRSVSLNHLFSIPEIHFSNINKKFSNSNKHPSQFRFYNREWSWRIFTQIHVSPPPFLDSYILKYIFQCQTMKLVILTNPYCNFEKYGA